MEEFLSLMEEVGESQAKLTIDRPDSPGSDLSARASPLAESWPETAELRSLGAFPIEPLLGSTSEATFEATCEAELTEEDPDARLARAIAQARRTEERMLSWLRDAKSVREWASALNLETLLAETDGIVSIPDFFPDFVAEGALQAIRRVHSREWQLSRKQEYGDADHSFRANDTADTIPEIIRALSNLFPALTPTFSAGRYSRADHIAAHDDKMVVSLPNAEGTPTDFSRDIALIWYLSPEWCPQFGGQLLDVAANRSINPEFNKAAVTTDVPRYSLFGWWLREGRLYEPDAPNGSRFKPTDLHSLCNVIGT